MDSIIEVFMLPKVFSALCDGLLDSTVPVFLEEGRALSAWAVILEGDMMKM